MTDSHTQLLTATRNYVTELFTHQLNPEFVFHNLEHTEDVVEACSHIAEYYKLEEEDQLILMVSAWFHDTGYIKGEAAGHEEESIRLANEFLTQREADETVTQRVSSAIQSTRMPQSPISQLEKILCDADLYHLATDDFKARSQLLKQEQESLLRHKISKKEWQKNNIRFLQTHKYFTDYGKEQLEPKKQENLTALLKKKQGKKEAPDEKEEIFPFVPTLTPFDNVDEKAQKKDAERGIQTMFRTTSHNHLELSSMADSKSHIMISVNSIIISVTLSFLIARIAHYPQYMTAAGVLLLTCLASITFAILSTRPSITRGRFTEEDIRNKKTNLLFFGNFHSMQLEDYQWGMNQMIKDREYLYNTMIMDIYFLGIVLAKKYRYLRIAYTIFMWGLILSVLAFGITALVGTTADANARSIFIDY